MRTLTFSIAATLVASLLATLPADAQSPPEIREFKSQSGSRLKAMILGIDDAGRVLLQPYSAKAVPLSSLSEEDQTFIKAWQNLDKFNGKAKLSSWLHRIASNLVIDKLRQKHKWNEEPLNDQDWSEQQIWQDQHELLDLDKALLGLSDRSRAVVILYEYLGYKHQEIAEMTGLPIGTSKSLLNRARAKLNQQAAAI